MREVIVKVGAEGGSLTMFGTRRDDTWWFAVTTDESSLAELLPDVDLDGIPLVRESGWVEGWDAGLALLDRYPWARLSPIKVHHEFRARVLAAVPERRGNLRAWQRAR